MKRWKLLLFAPVLCIATLVAACGDDDENSNPGPDGGGQADGPITPPPDEGGPQPLPDGGRDSGVDGHVDTTSFPKYVQSLIELKTDDKGTPDLEAVWGPIPDDDKFVYPASFFP